MKRYFLMCYLIFICLLKAGGNTQIKFSEHINNLWLIGKKQEVLKLAKKRLIVNSNDLSALFIKLDYEMSFMEVEEFSKTLDDILKVSKNINTPEFEKQRAFCEGSIQVMKELIPKITPEIIAEDAGKGYITNKPLSSLIFIQALEQDGLVPPVTEEEIQALNTPSQDHLQTNRSTSATPPNEIQYKTNQSFQPSSRSLNHQEVPLFSNRIYWVIGFILLLVLGSIGYYFFKKKT